MHGSPPHTSGRESIPGSASLKSLTTDCTNCAFSPAVNDAISIWASSRVLIDSNLSHTSRLEHSCYSDHRARRQRAAAGLAVAIMSMSPKARQATNPAGNRPRASEVGHFWVDLALFWMAVRPVVIEDY
jgi:hypothetical protein